ncbi:MAG: ABC transporter permease [Candidatus Dormibacteraceae bacterium]
MSSQPPATAPRRGGGLRQVVQSVIAPRSSVWTSVLVVLLAFFTALVVSAVFIILSDPTVFSAPDLLTALGNAGQSVGTAYGALLSGAVGSPPVYASALTSGSPKEVAHAFYPLSETVVAATPLVFTGLAVALGFRAGLFNIGGEGQVIAGGLAAGYVGFSVHGLPGFIELPLAVIAGFAAGALWGFVPGLLKARTGAHEVITTIMLNYVGIFLTGYCLTTSVFQRPGRTDAISRIVDPGAVLPGLGAVNLRVNAGAILAIAMAVVVYFVLWRTVYGFEFRAVGANPEAARVAGIGVGRTIMLAMSLAGGLAGLAGANIILGIQYSIAPNFSSGLGFDGITVALLGRGNPVGVVAAALLFGGLRAGAVQMQAATSTPVDLVQVIEALVILFVAAPALVRAIFRLRTAPVSVAPAVSPGWGS